MAFATASKGNTAIGDINVTPLVDVMLVLLVIFMIATPMLTQRIPLDLPQRGPSPPVPPPEAIRLHVDAAGALTWNGLVLPDHALRPSLQVEATRDPQPLLQIEINPEAPYERLAGVLATARSAGMARIGFVE